MKIFQNFLRRNLLVIIAFLIPFVFFILLTYVFPRPYDIFYTDAEQGMYYGSKLVYFGHQPADLSHPGMTSYYIGALIMMLSGPDIKNTQLFLQIGYFLVAGATGVTMALFSKKILKSLPFGIGLFSLIIFFCFSPVLMYSDMLNAGSFIFILSFLVLIFFWSALESENTWQRILYYSLTGVFLGISLANHVVSLILFAIVFLVGFIKTIAAKEELFKRFLVLFTLPISAIISYSVLMLPVYRRVPDIWTHLLNNSAIRASLEGLNTGMGILTSKASLLPETVSQMVIGLVFLIVLGLIFFRVLRAGHFTINKNWIYQALLITLLLLGLIYILATSADYGAPGVSTRYTMTFVALFPLAMVFLYTQIGENFKSIKKINLIAICISAIIFFTSLTGFFQSRSTLILQRTEEINNNLEYFETINPDNNGRIAFWDGSPGFQFGEMSFHFWGNYRYANNYFDSELLSAFPQYSYFMLRKVPGIIKSHSSDEIITGESQGEKINTIAFPARELSELRDVSIESLITLLNNRFGQIITRELEINGIQWYVFQVQSSN